MLDKLPNCDQNIPSINDIPSSANQHVFHASVLTSFDLRSVVANDAAIEHRLTDWHIERTFETVNNNPCDPRTLILPKVFPCKYCGAYKFYRETDRMCCAGGQIVLTESILPEHLVQLITSIDERSKEFQNMIRTYNNYFAFTTIGITCDDKYQRRDCEIYTVKVQGQIHHYLNDLIPQDTTKKMTGIQFYFYDPYHQVSNRLTALPRLYPSIVEKLVEVLYPNPYSEFLKHELSLDNIDQYHIMLRSDLGIDKRRYNKPTSTEVVGIWIEDESCEANSKLWDIRVYTKLGRSHRVQYYYGCYDPLQYVLIFPNGELGWHYNIPRVGFSVNKRKKKGSDINNTDDFTFEDILENEQRGFRGPDIDTFCGGGDKEMPSSQNRNCKRKTVCCREYYVYKFQVRENDRSYIVRFGRLFQQYIVNMYIKIESTRLDFFEKQPEKNQM
ncbi:hypothetical protein LIER_40060 [Lithospermum erythrorhizon]|uniref:Helitron helicase-like domain-containing protein n=1 Tax=Lithospermum erythrorhizon TaxID=34254 RepID=A0AAV3QP39_LITER